MEYLSENDESIIEEEMNQKCEIEIPLKKKRNIVKSELQLEKQRLREEKKLLKQEKESNVILKEKEKLDKEKKKLENLTREKKPRSEAQKLAFERMREVRMQNIENKKK